VSLLADRDGQAWEGEGPTYLVLEPDANVREAVRELPAAALAAAWADPWRRRGVEPPQRSVSELRRELEKRARQALKDAPCRRLAPLSEAAREWHVPERTLRAQIARGAREAQRNARGELAFELPVTTPVKLGLVASRPDPRILLLMAREGCQPGELHRLGYRRRTDGERWREASRW
jgi:hypothetical protein